MASTNATINLLVSGVSKLDQLVEKASKLEGIANRLSTTPLDFSRSSAARNLENIENKMYALKKITEDTGSEIQQTQKLIESYSQKIDKAQQRLNRLKNPETPTYKKLTAEINESAQAIDRLNDKLGDLGKTRATASSARNIFKPILADAQSSKKAIDALQDLADAYTQFGDVRKRNAVGRITGDVGLGASVSQIREQAAALSLVSNNVKIASSDFNKFSIAIQGANKKLAEAEQQRFRALAYGLSPQGPRQNVGRLPMPGSTESAVAGSRKLVASALAMNDTIVRSEAAMGSYLSYLEQLKSLVPVISNEYRALEERIAGVRDEMSGFGLRGQSMKIQPQLGPASRLDDPRSIIKRQNYYEEIEDRLSRIVAIEERIDQGFLTQNQKLDLRKTLYESFDLLVEKDLRASKRKTAELDRQRMSLERMNRRATPTATRIGASNIRTTDFSPLDAPKRLENIIRSGELLQEKLVGAQAKGVDIGDRLVRLQNVLNSAKADTFEISAKNLDILDEELNVTRQLLALQRERAANAKAEAAASQQLAKSVGRGQLDRGTLTSILGNLGRTDVAAKVFRGGRSGEQALSNIIENFNRSLQPAPPRLPSGKLQPMSLSGYQAGGIGVAGPNFGISQTDTNAEITDGANNVRGAVRKFFDKITSAVASAASGGGFFGGGRGGRPPAPPQGPDPGDAEGRINAARGDADRLLGLKDLANLSAASANQLELLSQALSETRNGLKMTDKGFDELTKALNRVDDQIARRDPNADLLTRGFGRRGGQAVGEGLIGGAFPLLFGQGVGAAALGGLGGALGGFAGGTLGFGLSLAGTALGSAFDTLVQTTQDTGNLLRDLTGNFEQIKESGLLASRGQEKLIGNLIEAGNKATAYALIQDELNRKIGIDGASKLKEAADAGDRMKRAMADLGVQLQLFIAGPLTDFLNKLASVIEGRALENRTQDLLSTLPQAQRANLQRDLEREARASSPFRGPLAFLSGFDPTRAGLPTGGGERSLIPQQTLRELIAKYTPLVGAVQQKPEDKAQGAIRVAEERLAKAQKDVEIFTKRNEGADILKGFKQQANAVRREQEDIDRQSFELRRDYEKQIEDIRRGVEEKITQLRQENAQKELEILVKQGQIREQQLKNAALAVRNELAGDELAQNLADAVTSYLGAQLSAQDQLEQRRKQFEIEISNQQIELEKYKGEIARNVAQLNLSTAEKVQEINRGIARRNEDAVLNAFAVEKEIAQLRIKAIRQELEASKAVQQAELARYEEQLIQTPFNTALLQVIKNTKASLGALTKGINDQNKILGEIDKQQAPAKLKEIPGVSAKGVSTAGVTRVVEQGNRLQQTLFNLESALINSNQAGNFEEFIGRISDLATGPFKELENSLLKSRKALGLVGDDFSIAIAIIQNSYEKMVDSLSRRPDFKLTPELLSLLNTAEKVTIEFEKLRPTIEFYEQSNNQLANSITQAKDEISGLLQPVSEYDKWLQIINSRGGLGINPKQEQEILRSAKALDNLNAKLKVLNGLRDVASGWTDSFIQLNKELLKGGNLLESVQRFAEGIADRTLDVLLEFTLRPLQDQLFKNLADFIGIEQERNPLLKPIEDVRNNTANILDAAIQLVRKAEEASRTLPSAPANNIVPTPGGRQLPSEPPKSGQWYREAQSSAVPTGQFAGIGGPDLPAQMGAGGGFQLSSQARALVAAAQKLGVSPLDLATIIGFETAGTYSPSKWGGAGGNYMGLIQFGPEERKAYGANPNQSFEEQVQGPVVKYFEDRFRKVGMSTQGADLLTLYRTVLGGNPKANINAADSFGTTPASGVARMSANRADALSRFFGGSEANIPTATQIAQAQSKPEFNADENARRMLEAFKVGREQVNAVYDSEIAASTQTTESLNQLSQSATQAADGLSDVGTQMSDSVTKFQKTVGAGLQAISSIAMGVGGAQMIRKGGAYNTLMGAASIFGSIGSVAGMFGKGGGLAGLFGGKPKSSLPGFTGPMLGLPAFASGGRPDPYEPALIGENGPEIWMPDRPGTVIPNENIYVPILDDKGSASPAIGRYARRNVSSAESSEGESGDSPYYGNFGRSIPYQRSETSREIDRLERVVTNPGELPPIKYESTRVNEYDFVTPEQLEESNTRTAKIARNQTIRELADSMKTRKRLGL